jgi:hypothetical protein
VYSFKNHHFLIKIRLKCRNLILKCNQKKLPTLSRKKSNHRAGKNIIHYVCTRSIGRVAERLGRGLQNLVQQFESARDLNKNVPVPLRGMGIFVFSLPSLLEQSKKTKIPDGQRPQGRFCCRLHPLADHRAKRGNLLFKPDFVVDKIVSTFA